MLTCMPTRLRIATDSHSALAPLCLESAPHSSPQPSNRPVKLRRCSTNPDRHGSLCIPLVPG